VKTVSRLSIAPVKGMGLVHPDEIALESFGVAANRRFFLVDADGRLFNQIRNGALVRIRPDYDEASGRLALRFPDDTVVDGVPGLGEEVVTDFYGRSVRGRIVEAAWSDPISALAGRTLRLVRCEEPGAGVDRGLGPVTILSDASLDALAQQVSVDGVDGRRFRMLVSVAGCEPHEEDGWLGGRVRVGDAVVRLHEQVARCAITTQNPESGVPDLDTLREISRYRGTRDDDGKSIDFGVFGEVETPGRVRVGDSVEPLR